MFKSVQLIYWPRSQVCIGCEHGRLLYDDDNPSAYICLKNKAPDEMGNCENRKGGDGDDDADKRNQKENSEAV